MYAPDHRIPARPPAHTIERERWLARERERESERGDEHMFV